MQKKYTVKYLLLLSKCNNIKITSTNATKLEPPTHSFQVVGLDEIYFYWTGSISVLKSSVFQIFLKHVPANTIIYLFLNWNGNLVLWSFFFFTSGLDLHYGQTEALV